MDEKRIRESEILLEKNKPIERRFFLSLSESHGDFIKKSKIFKEIENVGFKEDDPRLIEFINNINEIKNENIKYEEFRKCIENNIIIISKIFRKELVIPNFMDFSKKIKDIYEETKIIKKGEVASYIPQLERVDSNKYGISVCSVDGQRYNIGDTNDYFTVQSCCKPINYGIALEELGGDEVHKYVGREPSGQAFNELTLNKDGKPHNPLINSGAIMTSSLIRNQKEPSDRFEDVMNIWERLSGGIYKIGFNNSVYLSEKKTADRNYALAYFMKEKNNIKKIGFPENTNINETMELYFKCCSIEVTTEILSIVAGTLANGGINPLTNEKIWDSKIVKNILSMMLMCGMYDYSGEHAFKIGIPSKSGVAGAVMLVIPNIMGIVTWSPALDEIGNSVRGVEFSKKIGDIFNFHVFDNMADNTKINPIRNIYTSNKINEFSELCLSAQRGDLENLRKLFNLRIDMNQSDYDGRTALHLAVCENHKDIVYFLLKIVKVKKNLKDRWGNSAEDEANKIKNVEIIELFKHP